MKRILESEDEPAPPAASPMATCPFCNTTLPPLPTPPPADRLPCPRCGEPVPAARWPIDSGAAASTQAIDVPRRNSRRTLVAVLVVMMAMAVVGLCFALYTKPRRDERHPWAKVLPPPVVVQSPAELPALGYLPAGAAVVAGARVADLALDPVTEPLLAGKGAGPLDQVVRLFGSVGLKVEEVDHLAAGLYEGRAPRVVCVVRTRLPYDLKKLADAVQPARSAQYQQHAVFSYGLMPIGEATVWAVEAQTLVFVLRLEGSGVDVLQDVPTAPRAVDVVLSPKLRTLLAERIPRESLLWAAGDLQESALLASLPAAGAFASVQGFGFGLYPQKGITLLAQLHTADAKATRRLLVALAEQKLGDGQELVVQGPPPDNDRPEDQWVVVQFRAGAQGLRELLQSARPLR